jgi:hypothetical protein
MRRRSTQILAISLVLLFVFAAAGCGKKKTTTSTTTTTTTTVTEATTTTAASGTTTGAAGLGALAANCKALQGLGAQVAAAMQGAKGDVQKQADILKEFAAKTPTDVRADFQTIADAYSQLVNSAKSSGGKLDTAALLKVAAKFQDPKFQKALKHVETWVTNNCHS